MTLRARLIAILAALVAFGFLVSGVATYSALRSFLYDRVDEQLRQTQPIAIRELVESTEARQFGFDDTGDAPDLPIAAYAEARDAGGNVVASASFGFSRGDAVYVPRLPGDLGVSGGDDNLLTVAAREDPSYLFRALAAPTVSGGVLVVAIPLADAQDTLRRLFWIEVVVAAVLMAAIAALARALIRKELRPLDEMAGAATEIAGGDLSRRVEEGNPGTEVGRLGRALNRMLGHIEDAFQARKASEERMRRFLGDASHELRTPLTSIRGYAELFRRGAAERPEDLAVSMRRIEEEAARMGVLVDELLLLASADRVRPLEAAPVDLAAMLEDLAHDARATDPGRTITVDAEEVVVTADEVRLRQAVANLVRNALVHTPARTPVTLRLVRDGGDAVIAVEDRGDGLDEDALAHAFERFWRQDRSRARDTGGAGLGLAIVEAVARGHGGSVEARNLDGGGACFTIRIPAEAAAHAS
ncbi:MAG TPA: ATP-binding protein [Actinomycetota bacterium]|nr:ATP-binding protein [Actinomycetota bacterium]